MNPFAESEKYLEVQITYAGLAVLLIMALVIIFYRSKSHKKRK